MRRPFSMVNGVKSQKVKIFTSWKRKKEKGKKEKE